MINFHVRKVLLTVFGRTLTVFFTNIPDLQPVCNHGGTPLENNRNWKCVCTNQFTGAFCETGLLPFITTSKRSCGSVMFSEACVSYSVHSRAEAWTDTPSPWTETLPPPGRRPPGLTSSDGHRSGRYASY